MTIRKGQRNLKRGKIERVWVIISSGLVIKYQIFKIKIFNRELLIVYLIMRRRFKLERAKTIRRRVIYLTLITHWIRMGSR